MNNTNSSNADRFAIKNGLSVLIRPILPQDAALLQEFVMRLSPESIYFRFLEYIKSLTDQQAHQFANVDYKTRMAYVAVLQDEDPKIIGVARYSCNPEQPNAAEVGVVIEDLYQGHGLGTHLLQKLSRYALSQGVDTFIGAISPSNLRILKFIENTGLTFQRRYAEGVWEVEISLTNW